MWTLNFQLICVLSVVLCAVDARLGLKTENTAFDKALYENVLDPELCDEQVKHLRTHLALNLKFIDAGVRLPRSVLLLNSLDLGNYNQCLEIDEVSGDYEIQGKYCLVRIPLSQGLGQALGASEAEYSELLERRIEEERITRAAQQILDQLRGDVGERTTPDNPLLQMTFRLAVCVPRPCSVQQAMTSTLFNLTALGFQLEEEYCRLPDDKPWSGADTAAVVVFSVIGLLTLLSTCYDVNHIFIRKQDPKAANVLYRSFSVYTNGKRLTTFSSNTNTLQCLDGIRALAMLWVIFGHAFITQISIINFMDVTSWLPSARALWVTMAPFTVDTFLFITGLLLVYTTVGRMTGMSLLKQLPLFYLNRLLRLFPLLALTVLLQASVLHRMFDGPCWTTVANLVHSCREYWWTTLLNIQNYATPTTMCLTHSWYVAIDVQLHIVSPVVLFWVLSKSRKVPWIAMTATLVVLFATSSYYNVYKQFPGSIIILRRLAEDYMPNYYMNTFTRAAPFFVGMMFGYIFFMFKGEKPKIPMWLVCLFWACTFTTFGVISYAVYEVIQADFDNLVLDAIMATYSRSAWAVALGWMIFACVHGYGGPINWFLSLDMWRLPARLSYAMFLLHYPLQFVINSTEKAPVFFSVPAITFQALAFVLLTFILSFFACLLVDAPCSVLSKLLLGGGVKKEKPRSDVNGVTTKKDLPTEELTTRIHSNSKLNA